jgi:RNA polymerase sigma-70 factor (ECF subfamily)
MVRNAQDPRSPERLAAMNRCVAGYWRPVFYYLRAREYPFHQAEDLAQEFFLRFFEKNWIRPADPARGRFRTFLLTILKRFLSDQGPDRAPRQKTFDDQLVSISALISDQERSFEPAAHENPENVFMKQWALAVIANARRALELWCDERGRPDWYQIFSAVNLPAPGQSRLTQQALADRLRLTRDQVRYALEEVNAQFVTLLRNEVAEQVETNDELDTEIGDLQQLLGE